MSRVSENSILMKQNLLVLNLFSILFTVAFAKYGQPNLRDFREIILNALLTNVLLHAKL